MLRSIGTSAGLCGGALECGSDFEFLFWIAELFIGVLSSMHAVPDFGAGAGGGGGGGGRQPGRLPRAHCTTTVTQTSREGPHRAHVIWF